MLSVMRKHAGSWIIKFLLAAIIVVFIPWGVQRYTSQRSSRVAEVNGAIITLDDYRNTYSNLIEQMRQTFGDNLSDDLIESLQLRKRALDQLVDKILMLQAAETLKIQVSDQELAEYIRNIGVFQTAGTFDQQRYVNTLNRNRLTPEAFEAQQREAMVIAKLQSIITGNVKVSDLEAQQWYKWNNTEVDLDYLLLEPKQFKNIEPNDEEIQDYFEQHKESYKTAPKIKVRYLYLKPEDYESKVTLSEDDILDYYESYPDQFKTPKTVQARHILIAVGQDAEADEVESARKRAETVMNLAKEGRDFAELAKQYSEGPSKSKGGDLGAFTREMMVKPFSDKAFSMQAGEISDPVRTRFGWHIIKVEKINPAKTLSLDEARGDIQKKLKADRSKNLAYDEVEALFDASFEGKNLADIAEEHNLKIKTTEYFSPQKPPEGITDAVRFASAAFKLPVDEVSDIQDFGDGYYLLEVIDKVPPKIPELKTVEAKVRKDVIDVKKDEKARVKANAILTELKDGQPLSTVSQKFNLTPKQTGFFKRNDSIPTIGNEPEIAHTAFELSDKNKLPEEAIKGQKGYFVIQFRERKVPSLDGFKDQEADIRQRLLQQKKYNIMDTWLTQKKGESEISIEEDFWMG